MDELRISVHQQPQSRNFGESEKKESGVGIQPLATASSSECTITEIRESRDPRLVRPMPSKLLWYSKREGRVLTEVGFQWSWGKKHLLLVAICYMTFMTDFLAGYGVCSTVATCSSALVHFWHCVWPGTDNYAPGERMEYKYIGCFPFAICKYLCMPSSQNVIYFWVW